MKGSLKPVRPGVWLATYDLPRGSDGKRRQRRKTICGTKKAAEKELTALLMEANTGSRVEPSQLRVRDHLLRWLEVYARVNVGKTTLQAYESHICGHLIPALGDYRLQELTPQAIQQYYADALTAGRKLSGKTRGLSPRTVHHHHVILKAALGYAVRWGLLARNPADLVDGPRVEDPEKHVLNEEQVDRLLRAVRGTPLGMIVALALGTAMRRGEQLAVRWEDTDLERHRLWVRQSLIQVKGRQEFKAPKSVDGRRMITLPAPVVVALIRHKEEQAAWRLEVGPGYRDQGLVIARPDGGPMHPDTVSKQFAKLAERLGFPEVRFHDLRGTHASLLAKFGVHPRVVQERLGHADMDTTMSVYTTVPDEMHERAAARLDDVLRAAGE
jgi:integrase